MSSGSRRQDSFKVVALASWVLFSVLCAMMTSKEVDTGLS